MSAVGDRVAWDRDLIADACQTAQSWGCRKALAEQVPPERVQDVVQALIRPDDPRTPWLSLYSLDETLLALGLILGQAKKAAHEALRSSVPQLSPISETLLQRCKEFGMWKLRRELADIAFTAADPARYAELRQWFDQFQRDNQHVIDDFLRVLRESISSEDVLDVIASYCSVEGADRRLRRLRPGPAQRAPQLFTRVSLITVSTKACYAALEAVHSIGVPEPGSFRDLIANPEPNAHSGLLTSIWFSANGATEPIQRERELPVFNVRIQTALMAQLSDQGISHAAFRKHLSAPTETRAEPSTKRAIMHLTAQMLGGSRSKITVFTAKGEARQVPDGATALDLAYRIHTDIGNYALAAEVNDRLVALGSPLPSGARVRVIYDLKSKGRTEDDLWSVIEQGNRLKIRRFVNREPIRKARLAIMSYLSHRGLAASAAEVDGLAAAMSSKFGHNDATSLFRAVAEAELPRQGPGTRSFSAPAVTSAAVGGAIIAKWKESVPADAHPTYDNIETDWVPEIVGNIAGVQSLRFRLCSHCRPSHRTEIVGIKKGRRVTVHAQTCRWTSVGHPLALSWQRVHRNVTAEVAVTARDRPMLLTNLLAVAHELNAGIGYVRAQVSDGGLATARFRLSVHNAVVLARLIDMLSTVRSVLSATLESAALPPEILDRIRQHPRDHALISWLEDRGYGAGSVRHVLVAPSYFSARVHGSISLPYSANKPTASADLFFGRQSEIRWLTDVTVKSAGGMALVTGPGRIGKTSLCLRFVDSHDEAVRPQVTRLDLRMMRYMSTTEAFGSLIAQLNGLSDIRVGSRASAASVLKVAEAAVMNQRGKRLILVFDEFGGPLLSFAEGRMSSEFFQTIGALMDLPLSLSLVLVGLPDVHELMRVTAMWKQMHMRPCPELTIGPLEPVDARRMITQPFYQQGVHFTDRSIQSIETLSGRQPLYLILLLLEAVKILNADSTKTSITDGDVTKAVERLLRSRTPFAYLVDRFAPNSAEYACLAVAAALARTAGSVEEHAWWEAVSRRTSLGYQDFQTAVRTLVAENVIGELRVPQQYGFTVPLVVPWLRQHVIAHGGHRVGA